MSRKISDSWFYFPIIILSVYFIVRLVDQSKIVRYFPLDVTNDVSSYMAQLHFLKVCGFHNFCPYWYNGFTTFSFSQPGWYFFAFPLYYLTNDVKVATFLSILLIFILAFLAIFLLYKHLGLSKLKRVAFFFFFFANAIAIGNFIRLGRAHELFAWLNFVILAFLLLWYKDHKLDKKFFIGSLVYGIILISHQAIATLSIFLIGGLFLVKKGFIEKTKVVLMAVLSFLIASFWLIPFIQRLYNSSIPSRNYGNWLWLFTKEHLLTNIAATIIPLALFIAFYSYWSNNKSRKELIFFLPVLLLNLVFLFRLTPFMPILGNIIPDQLIMFLLFFLIFFFLKTDFDIYGKLRNLVLFFLILIPILSVVINIVHTPNFLVPGELEEEIVSTLPYVRGSFIMLGDFPPSSSRDAYYSYAPIYFNLSSPGGWYDSLATASYVDGLANIHRLFDAGSCNNLMEQLSYFNVTEIIAYSGSCDVLEGCGLAEKIRKEDVCLYSL